MGISNLLKNVYILILALIFLHNTTRQPLFAQNEGLTLSEAEKIAMENNPLIKGSLSKLEMAEAEVRQSYGKRLPLIQLSETFTRSNNPVFVFGSLLEQERFGPDNFETKFLNDPPYLNNFRTTLSLNMPIFDRMQSKTEISQSRIKQQQSLMHKEMVTQQIRFDLIRTYYGLLVAKKKKEVADESVKMAETEVERIRNMFETGMVVESDLLSARVHLAEFIQQQIRSKGDIAIASADLNAVLGLPINSIHDIAGEIGEKDFEAIDQEEIISSAIKNRPDYLIATLAIDLQEESIKKSQGGYLPRLDLFASTGKSGENITSGSRDNMVGANLIIDIIDFGRRSRIQEARSAATLSATELEQISNQIRLEAVRAYQQHISAREWLKVADDTVDQSKEGLRIVKNRYEAGLTTIVDLLRSETAHVQARMNLIAALYDYYLSYAKVLLASGKLKDIQPFIS